MPNAQSYTSFQQYTTRKCLAAGRAINARKILSKKLDKESYHGPPSSGLGMGLALSFQKTQLSQNPCNEDTMAQNGDEVPQKIKKTRKQMFQHV
jgi:hypothetical protein